MPSSSNPPMSRYWRRSILIPLWTQQLFFQLFFFAIFGFLFSVAVNEPNGSILSLKWSAPYIAAWCALYATLIILTIVETVLCVWQRLSPKAYLWLNVAKTSLSVGTFMVGVFVPLTLNWIRAARRGDRMDPLVMLGGFLIWVMLFVFMQGPMVAALIHAVLLRKEQDAIWTMHEVVEEDADETTPLQRSP